MWAQLVDKMVHGNRLAVESSTPRGAEKHTANFQKTFIGQGNDDNAY